MCFASFLSFFYFLLLPASNDVLLFTQSIAFVSICKALSLISIPSVLEGIVFTVSRNFSHKEGMALKSKQLSKA